MRTTRQHSGRGTGSGRSSRRTSSTRASGTPTNNGAPISGCPGWRRSDKLAGGKCGRERRQAERRKSAAPEATGTERKRGGERAYTSGITGTPRRHSTRFGQRPAVVLAGSCDRPACRGNWLRRLPTPHYLIGIVALAPVVVITPSAPVAASLPAFDCHPGDEPDLILVYPREGFSRSSWGDPSIIEKLFNLF